MISSVIVDHIQDIISHQARSNLLNTWTRMPPADRQDLSSALPSAKPVEQDFLIEERPHRPFASSRLNLKPSGSFHFNRVERVRVVDLSPRQAAPSTPRRQSIRRRP
jgi:hypothetical protein